MATTYERIRTTLHQAARKNSWPTKEELASEIRKRKLAAFRIRGKGTTKDDFIKEKSIEELLDLVTGLDLLSVASDSTISITERGRNCLDSEEAFARQIKSSVKSYLEKHSLPLHVIFDHIKKIQLPNVPDATTIYNSLPQSRTSEFDEYQLRKVLYLLACAQGISRKIKVYYEAG